MCGVLICGWPLSGPTQSFRSSMAIISTLGLAGPSARAGERRTQLSRTKQRMENHLIESQSVLASPPTLCRWAHGFCTTELCGWYVE